MQLLGHRGAPDAGTPENTLAAVERALTAAADGVEVDVRLTADGVPVCHHDHGLRRTAGDRRRLSELTWEQVQRLPLAVPRLADVLAAVEGRGRLVVELKVPAWRDDSPGDLVAVAGVLARHDLRDVVVSCFDPVRLSGLKQLLDVRSGLLLRPGVSLAAGAGRALADGHDEVHPHVQSALRRLDLVSQLRAAGLEVVVWTVNRPDQLLRLRAAGVGAAICDDPAAARLALQPALREQTA